MLDELFTEAERQLNICNSCRYCEGYCAVFPALERRTLLDTGDITQLANLCHDCRACFHACMYAPPHEFAVDPPRILSAVRLASYDRYLPPVGWLRPGWSRGWPARVTAGVLVGLVLLVVAGVTEGLGALWRHGGPYQIIPYPALLVVVLLPTVCSVAVLLRGLALYWNAVHGPLRGLADWRALGTALAAAVRLRNMRGGGRSVTRRPMIRRLPIRRRPGGGCTVRWPAGLPRASRPPWRPRSCRTCWAARRPIRCCPSRSSWARRAGSACWPAAPG